LYSALGASVECLCFYIGGLVQVFKKGIKSFFLFALL